jgi:hypothetical protein
LLARKGKPESHFAVSNLSEALAERETAFYCDFIILPHQSHFTGEDTEV